MIQRRIVGTGNVGTAAAYALFNQRLASELVLLDLDTEHAEGEAMDLMHGQTLVGRVAARAAEKYADLAGAQLIVISPPASASPRRTRRASSFWAATRRSSARSSRSWTATPRKRSS